MRTIYSKEQLWEMYKKLPEQIREAMSSEEMSDAISEICQKNNLSGENSSSISNIINEVLFGLLPAGDFQKTIEMELGLKKDAAKKISQEIDRFVFSPVSAVLGKTLSTEKKEEPIKTFRKEDERKKKLLATEEKPKSPSRDDTYREIIE